MTKKKTNKRKEIIHVLLKWDMVVAGFMAHNGVRNVSNQTELTEDRIFTLGKSGNIEINCFPNI